MSQRATMSKTYNTTAPKMIAIYVAAMIITWFFEWNTAFILSFSVGVLAVAIDGFIPKKEEKDV